MTTTADELVDRGADKLEDQREAPTNAQHGTPRRAPGGPQLGTQPKAGPEAGPNPWLVVGGALAAGIAIAKTLDWRGRAHPND